MKGFLCLVGAILCLSALLGLLNHHEKSKFKGSSNSVTEQQNAPKELRDDLDFLCRSSDMCFDDGNTEFNSLLSSIVLKPKDRIYDFTLISNPPITKNRQVEQNSEADSSGAFIFHLFGGFSAEKSEPVPPLILSLDEYCRTSELCVRRTSASYDDMLGAIRSIGLDKHHVRFYMKQSVSQ